MDTKAFRTAAAIALLGFAGIAPAQAPDNTVGPATGQSSRDGDRPSDGAIKGGSIVPGETGGMPSDKAKNRCNDLTGTLREQCLLQEQGASTGGTRTPDPDITKSTSPREAPPPQNPR
jgi:hypothetical protein